MNVTERVLLPMVDDDGSIVYRLPRFQPHTFYRPFLFSRIPVRFVSSWMDYIKDTVPPHGINRPYDDGA